MTATAEAPSMRPPRHQQQQQQQQLQDELHGRSGIGDSGLDGASTTSASAGAGDRGAHGHASGGDCRPLPPRIRRATKMTRRIQNLYGDADAGGSIACRHCSKRIVVGSAMRRVKRTGRCWHDECYAQASGGGRLPPKILAVRTLTKRTRKLFGTGDDRSVLCQMCGADIKIGQKMRRATGTGMCWHEQCYRLTWWESLRRAAAPARRPYKISNTKWKRMLSDCLKCAGSRLCDEHRRMEAEYRVPRDAGEDAGAAAETAAAAAAAAG